MMGASIPKAIPFLCNKFHIFLIYYFTLYQLTACGEAGNASRSNFIEISMPDVRPTQDDDYICTYKNVSEYGTQYIHAFEPNSNADRAHHMLLFACNTVPEQYLKTGRWDCGHHTQACQRIIYAWAKNAPPTVLPKDVGLRIGPESGLSFIVLQVHYAHPLPEGTTDRSGFKLHISPMEPPYLAGVMILYRYSLFIPPDTEKVYGDMNCQLTTDRPIHPFAYRVHTHKLGSVVSGYVYNRTTGFRNLGKGNPQWPQAFYPIQGKPLTVNPGEFLAARCTYSTVGFHEATEIGQTAGDEMCNLYIMYYTDSRNPEEHSLECAQVSDPLLNNYLPPGNDVPLPRNETLEEHAKGHSMHSNMSPAEMKKKNHTKKRPGAETGFPDYTDVQDNRLGYQRKLPDNIYSFVEDWPTGVQLGQATGVDFDKLGNVVVFHRGDRVWGAGTFNNRNEFTERNKGPISTDTVYVIHPSTGKILHQWGKNLFYLPHDISVGPKGDTFLTDVALHQVFKFPPGSTAPSLVLGKQFEPGNDDLHFCKPAAVAEMSSGDFFVADGYCNSRIIKFDSRGNKLLEIGRRLMLFDRFLNRVPPPYSFYIPHALALSEEQNLLCVADRENQRIQCFTPTTLQHIFNIEARALGGSIYSVSYSEMDGGTLYAVSGGGNTKGDIPKGYIISLKSRSVTGVFVPPHGFGLPHDIAVSPNGSSIYVSEISRPYRILKFVKADERIASQKASSIGSTLKEPSEPAKRLGISVSALPSVPNEGQHSESSGSMLDQESVIIMAFLTIPLLGLIGIGALIRLRSRGCCKRSKDTKSFSEFFPPSAGFEKLRMDESESDNSDTEIEEFTVPSYRKAHA